MSNAPKTDTDFSSSPDFYARHQQELGVGQFTKVTARNTLLPLVTAAIPGAVGYFLLRKPMAGLRVVRGMEIAFDGVKGLGHLDVTTIPEMAPGLQDAAKEAMARLLGKDPEFKLTSIASITRLLKEASIEEYEAILKVIGAERDPNSAIPKLAGAAVLGVPGLVAGSVAVGYDEWRKQETPRVAAREIGDDIARMELFKPSDPELVAENKRLRAMLAEAPHAVIGDREHQGLAGDAKTAAAARG